MSALKKTLFVFTLALSALTVNITAFAARFPETVRVGLSSSYANKDSIKISNSSLYIGAGAEDEFEEIGIIESSDGFVIQMPEGYYVDCKENFDTYEDAIEYIEDANFDYDAYPAMVADDEWSVFICNIDSASEAEDIADDVNGRAITTTTSILEISDGRDIIAVSYGIWPQFAPEGRGEYITLGSKSYRGCIEFGRYKGSFITAVNVISMDEYLYSVVPAEMPHTWHEEALKAQIVAARSYAYTRINAHSADGYGLCDGTNCQVYGGINSEKSNVNDLIDDISGVLALYEDEPINAVYCSSSGGHTDNCENVWTATIPYLRGVKEIFDTKGTTWSRTFSADDIAELCEKDGTNVGRVESIDITCSTLTGRVQKMTIYGSRNSHTLSKEGIRSFFSSMGGYLPSRMFTLNGLGITDYEGVIYTEIEDDDDVIILDGITDDLMDEYDTSGVFKVGKQKFALAGNYTPKAKVTASGTDSLKTFTASGSSYNFSGYGNGHGIGLSQYGAKEMAENGYTYDEILKHYYTGIEVE